MNSLLIAGLIVSVIASLLTAYGRIFRTKHEMKKKDARWHLIRPHKKRRLLLGNSSLILGASYALLPFFVGSMIGISALLFTSGTASTFFVPLLDGVGAGIYGVVIALMCSDLTKGKSGFNTLLGIMQRKHLDRFGS